MFEFGPEALWETMEEASDAYAEAAAEEMVPAVVSVLAAWQMPTVSPEAEARRQRLLTLPGFSVVAPALTEEGVNSMYDDVCEGAGGEDWSCVHLVDGALQLTTARGVEVPAPTPEELAEALATAHAGIAEGCAAPLVRALAASIDGDGYLVGALDDAMLPYCDDAKSTFNLYMDHGDGKFIDRELVLRVLREVKQSFLAGKELPQALSDGFPRRPVG